MRFKSFEALIADIGFKPSPKLSLDRIDNSGHYEPGNVRWSTPEVQVLNRRLISAANTSGYRGVSKRPRGWQARIGFLYEQYRLGSNFPTPEAAARAYDAKALELHGEYARLNFPPSKPAQSAPAEATEATA
jgi:hypothetical protein